MLQLLVILSALEVVLALAVLAIYLFLIQRSLRASFGYAAKISFGVRAIEVQAGQIGPAVTRLNGTLREIAEALPGIAEKAERAARG